MNDSTPVNRTTEAWWLPGSAWRKQVSDRYKATENATPVSTVDPAIVERARVVFCNALVRRVNTGTPLGDVPVQALREAMAEALEVLNDQGT